MSGGVPYKRSRPDGTISNMTAVMDSDPVYYTTTIVSNLSNDTGTHGAPAIFSESRIVPIIPDTYNYGVSLESLRVDTKSVPTFIADRDQKSSDPSILKQEVGIDMVWTGSMFPSYDGTVADPTIMYVGTSPLPYAYNSTGSVVNPNAFAQALGNQAGVQGIETFFRINDPNGVEWQGAPISNCTLALVQSQMEQSLARAFGTFVTSPYSAVLDSWPVYWNSDYSELSIGYVSASVIPQNASTTFGPNINIGAQIYLDRFFYGAPTTSIVPPFPVALDGFYIIKSFNTIAVGASFFYYGIDVTTSLPQQKALKEYVASGGTLPDKCTASFEDYVWSKFSVGITSTKLNPANPAQINLNPRVQQSHSDILYKLTISRAITYGDPTFTEVHSSMNLDFTNTFTAGNTMTKGIYFTVSGTTAVTYITPATLYLAQYGTQVLANLTSFSRSDQLLSARTLGFSPNAVFQFGSQNTAVTGVIVTPAVLPRTVNRAFVTSMPMTASTRLRWVTQDSYAATRNPAPYSSYYYGYSIQSFLDDVVNPAFERVLKDDPIDKYFVTPTPQGNQPYQCFQVLTRDHPEIKTITDLSLSSQLYCRTYFNSANAQYSQLSVIAVYNKLTQYIAGFPVLSPNLVTKEMMLFISNGPSNEPEPPKTPISTEGWLYCGIFLFSSVVFDQTYFVGQAVTYDGIVYTCTTQAYVHDQTDLTANFTTGFIALSAVTSKNRIQNTYQTPPELATSAPSIQANTIGGDYGNTFSFHLDAYSSGSPWCESRDPILAYYRNSWGEVNGQSTIPILSTTLNQVDVFSGSYGRKYDESIQIHANTQFVNLFSGFNVYCSEYVNPSNGVRTAYWYYNFKITPQMQLTQGGNVEGSGPSTGGSGVNNQVQYIPYNRTNNARPFTWRIDSSETSRYTHWNPALSVVVEAQVLSMEPQPNSEPVVLRDNDSASDNTSGRTNKIVAEAFLERHPSEGPVIYYPQTGTRKVALTSGPVVKSFSYSVLWRNRFTGETVPLLLSNGGSVVAIFKFHAK
jgi:hypothetical protein